MSSVSVSAMATAINNAINSIDYGTEAEPKSVTQATIVNALATGICSEVNAWITAEYDPHVVTYNGHTHDFEYTGAGTSSSLQEGTTETP